MPSQVSAGVDVNQVSVELDPRWELVQKVAASHGFRKSPRIRAFLLYVCELALRECPEGLSEQQIGIHVFARPAGYNPGEDNIVRAQARILRWKLEEYFGDEGRTEAWTIAIPKGGYHPEFHPRAVELPDEALAAPAAPPHAAPESVPVRPGYSPLVLSLSLVIVVLGAMCVWLATTRTEKDPAGPGNKAFAALWNGFLGPSQRTIVVIPDNTLSLLELATGPISLQEIISGDYQRRAKELSRNAGIEGIFPGFTDTRRTFMTSAIDTALIARVWHSPSSHLDVRSAVDLRVTELNSGNAILIGARPANPWMQLFDQNLNFVLRYDRSQAQRYFENRHPRQGEPGEYRNSLSGPNQTAFGGLAYLPSMDRRGNILMIIGADEIAAAFITNEKLSSRLLETLTAQSGTGKLPHFEVLLKAMAIGGQPASTAVEAYRIVRETAADQLPGAATKPSAIP